MLGGPIVTRMNAIVFAALLTVEIVKPQISIVSTTKIEALCDGKSEQACTTYRETSLTCDCVEHDGKWSVQAHTRTVPYMYMISPRFIEHEALHMGDIQQSLQHYVDKLAAAEFDSTEDCRARANEAMRKFPSTMREFQLETTLKRDGRVRR